MLASARHLEALPHGHPCQGCEVRDKAVCGILDCTSLEQFRNLGWTLRLSPGQALFHEGDPATRVFTLTSGTLKLYKLLADGRRQVTGFLHPGDFLGISIDDEHAFSAEALEHSQLCWFPRARFDDSSRTMRRWSASSTGWPPTSSPPPSSSSCCSAERRRPSAWRLSCSCSSGSELSNGVGAGMVRLPMSRSDIADYLGLTKETVSRVISALKRDRVIRLQSLDVIQILDRGALEQLAEAAA